MGHGGSAALLIEDPADIRRVERHIPGPAAESSVGVDAFDPLGEKPAFGLVLGRVLALDLEDKDYLIGKPDQEVRPIFLDDAAKYVVDLEAEMVVLYPGDDVLLVGAVQGERFAGFPRAVEYADVHMG